MTGERDDDERAAEREPRLASGAHALGALSPDEAAEFERAAAQAPEVRAEADELAETAALLGFAAEPARPSAGMKLDLMAAIASTPQDAAPDVVRAVTGEREQPPAAAGPSAAPAGSAEHRARTRWFARPLGIAVAAAAAIALFVGGSLVGSALNAANQTTPADQAAAALAEIAAAPDSQRASASVDGGGTATLVWSNELGRSAVLVDGLPSLPSGKAYEAWYIDASGAAASAGTFTAAGDGTTWHVLDGTMSAGDAVGVTVEPAGGSEQPTTDPILVMQSA
ncbi:anti-sigma factor [Compostimonas suwonensis]|uniref:Regulator of SigK n=1 Tax=Compostimonas suwonensis TaxID=1048394 RepID=A0A2M9BWY0_9MICO|nr:anti-sigma factor [Compostimonas suwonensis]PJJ62435.1 anti-sigma-K factor rskA [Compostimonas suwonensis]